MSVERFRATVPERLAVHLLDYVRYIDSDAAELPYALTQDGIADALGIGRAHVAMALKALRKRNLIDERTARIRGELRRRKCYMLTPGGLQQAMSLTNTFSEKKIRLRYQESEKETTLGEATKELGITLTESLRAMDTNGLLTGDRIKFSHTFSEMSDREEEESSLYQLLDTPQEPEGAITHTQQTPAPQNPPKQTWYAIYSPQQLQQQLAPTSLNNVTRPTLSAPQLESLTKTIIELENTRTQEAKGNSIAVPVSEPPPINDPQVDTHPYWGALVFGLILTDILLMLPFVTAYYAPSSKDEMFCISIFFLMFSIIIMVWGCSKLRSQQPAGRHGAFVIASGLFVPIVYVLQYYLHIYVDHRTLFISLSAAGIYIAFILLGGKMLTNASRAALSLLSGFFLISFGVIASFFPELKTASFMSVYWIGIGVILILVSMEISRLERILVWKMVFAASGTFSVLIAIIMVHRCILSLNYPHLACVILWLPWFLLLLLPSILSGGMALRTYEMAKVQVLFAITAVLMAMGILLIYVGQYVPAVLEMIVAAFTIKTYLPRHVRNPAKSHLEFMVATYSVVLVVITGMVLIVF